MFFVIGSFLERHNQNPFKYLDEVFFGMVCRNQLAAIDFNLLANLELSGQENLSFSKIAKPIKVNKDKNKFARMIKWVVSIVESGEILPLPEILILPKNIALGDRLNKEEVSHNQKSQFDKLH